MVMEQPVQTADQRAIDICVCTFRRPQATETLRSLSRLTKSADWRLRVIVADNDDTPSARERVESTALECGLNLLYVHAPARNISIARNACLDAATAPLVAFIDDDEIAMPGWLMALVAVLDASNADVVLGQVQAVYGSECPDWMKQGDFHSIKPVFVAGEIRTGYTCNVLLRQEALAVKDLRFDPNLGRSGGEDTVYFAAVHRAKGRIAYAPEAVLKEAVTPNRALFA
nr:glycosyltransferase [Pseudomonadota bacterium]